MSSLQMVEASNMRVFLTNLRPSIVLLKDGTSLEGQKELANVLQLSVSTEFTRVRALQDTSRPWSEFIADLLQLRETLKLVSSTRADSASCTDRVDIVWKQLEATQLAAAKL
ncbi:hypothetical protein EIP91_005157 [Steccherinum ochraceum]|uniref:Uncharacterized protein n=1 Tax=Steccherinum ochraceum TaxID=92696 RepID=A0A4R0R7K5_9APHY|nr:hypothetical protein EIP91_005157 [Steccherinum ochraceum]